MLGAETCRPLQICKACTNCWFCSMVLSFSYRVFFVVVLLLGVTIPPLLFPSASSYRLAESYISPHSLFVSLRSATIVVEEQFFAPLYSRLLAAAAAMGSSASTLETVPQKSVHEFTVQDASGNNVDLSTYKGKVLLIVNVASQCGLTQSNYKELTELHNKYREKDFEILAFPCNQFGGQEPGTNEEIKEFACTRFKADFPIFEKISVNGADTAPLYKFLKANKGGGILGDSIKWNFSKFLVDKEGNVVNRYAPVTSPSKIEKDIKKVL